MNACCLSVSDINECMDDTLNECSPNADCLNTEGTYDCTCRTGYSGDGRNCGELRKERHVIR